MINGPGMSLNSPSRAPGDDTQLLPGCPSYSHTTLHMTNRQHQLIMSLYARCDEIHLQMEAHQANASEYIKLTGAFNELMDLAKKLTDQFNAEAEALRQVESYITPKVNINA